MTQARDPEPLATALAALARDLLAQDTVQTTLDRIVTAAVDLVDGCEAAGLMVVRDGRVSTLAATDDVARTSERIQGELGEGPCFDAHQQQEAVFRLTDVSVGQERWPRFVDEARRLGIGSTVGFLLFTDDDNHLGALNLYSSRRAAFTERSEQVGLLLASHAAVAFAGARHEAHLREAMLTRQTIGEAVGIVMERHKIDADEAFALLVRASQNTNTKLRDLARQVAHTGQIPAIREPVPPVTPEMGRGTTDRRSGEPR